MADADKSHCEEAKRGRDLRGKHPAPALAQNFQDGHAIQQRRPDELQRIGDAYPRDKADGLERGAFVAQPKAERVSNQKKGQAGRKTQRRHGENFGAEIFAEGIFAASHAATVWGTPSFLGNKPANISSSSAGSTGLVRKP